MDFTPSQEQQALRESIKALLAASASDLQTREVMVSQTGTDLDLWLLLAKTGMTGLCVPETYGGSGAGLLERSIVLEELGRSLACVPYLSTAVVAADVLSLAGNERAAGKYLPAMVDGSLIATVAIAEDAGSWAVQDIMTTAASSGDGWTLTGVKSFVLDALLAELIIVAARTSRGLALFAVTPNSSTALVTPHDPLDPTRRMGRLVLSGAAATLICAEDEAGAVLAQVLDRASLALAGEQVGGAQRCLDDTVHYVKTREQFGTPIGSFQAVKHRCADMLLDVEAARVLLSYGACVGADPDQLADTVGLVKATCSESFLSVASASVQLHAGIGFTWEHAAHLFHKRALTSMLLFGDATYHRDQFMNRAQRRQG